MESNPDQRSFRRGARKVAIYTRREVAPLIFLLRSGQIPLKVEVHEKGGDPVRKQTGTREVIVT